VGVGVGVGLGVRVGVGVRVGLGVGVRVRVCNISPSLKSPACQPRPERHLCCGGLPQP